MSSMRAPIACPLACLALTLGSCARTGYEGGPDATASDAAFEATAGDGPSDGGWDDGPAGDATVERDGPLFADGAGTGPPVAAFCDISGSGPHPADGVATSTITIVLRDVDNLPVAGVVPTFAASGTGNELDQSCGVSDARGISTCAGALRSTVVGDKVLSIVAPVQKTGGMVRFTTVPVFRSVGPGSEAPIATGASGALTVRDSLATFASPLPDRAGVGDVLQYDTDGDGVLDALAFVHGRRSSTEFAVRDVDGLAAADTRNPVTDWALLRAYNALAAAESGSENPAIAAALREFERWSAGADLVALQRIWNIACYGDAPDRTAISIRGWVSDAEHYLRIFTPTQPSEVGTSQRHAGVWNDGKYHLLVTISGDYANAISAQLDGVRIEGLQVLATGGGNIETHGIAIPWGVGQTDIYIHDNIVQGQLTTVGGGGAAILVADDTATSRVWNNIVYDWSFSGQNLQCIHSRGSGYIYHNTVFGCRLGILADPGIVVRNNVALGSSSQDYSGTPHADSTHNAGVTTPAGTSPIALSSASPADYFFGASDFRLDPSAPLVGEIRDRGLDLSADPGLAVALDIAGTTRPQGTAVDPGAFEAR